eukprot:TRINITY_DN2336_c1_g1_i1.p1 TRINITY_DN2336_c1_g1~~TRINITY_DN2336_c1_g1_i1.p1  ORF type:complete len:280 (+),score=82.95 TRINITY_DN2336_c1_g1_i1:50-841(+)
MAAAMTREMPRHAFPDFHERGLFDGCDGANETRLREMLRTAEFWIAVLEGEQQEILEESAKQRRESEAALRNAVAGAAAKEQEVRELEGERRRLQEEVQWLQKSRDEALCEKALLRHDGKRVQGDAETISSRAETLEAELRREREEKSELESQLVRTKVRFAEAMELADGMEATIVHYEEQLRALDPSFEPKGRITLGQWRRVAARGHEGDSNASSEQNTPRASASRDAVAPAIAMSQEGSERHTVLRKRSIRQRSALTIVPT